MEHNHEHTCCGCEKCAMHEHEHEHENNALIIIRIIVSALLTAGIFIVEHFTKLELPPVVITAVYVAAFLIIGYEVIINVIKNLIHFDIHDIFDEELLMLIAAGGAFCLGEQTEAVVIMLFYQIGEFFQDKAIDKSRESIAALTNLRPDFANRLMPDGSTEKVDPCEVQKGELIVVKAGERIPLDGIIESGECSIDTSALTGESVPRYAGAGDEVMSGTVNQNGRIVVRTTGMYDESSVAKILALIETDDKSKSKSERFINRFARVYTPIVVISAVLLAVLPPVITGTMAFSEWVHRALLFLVVSCPCALVISVPLAFFSGIGKASRHGILIKGSGCMDKIARMKTVALDKTGTLTTGTFAVTEVLAEDGFTREEVLRTAKSAEINSNHPIARAVANACADTEYPLISYEECAGRGVRANISKDGADTEVLVGNAAFMAENEIQTKSDDNSFLFVAVSGVFVGRIKVEDSIKEGAKEAVATLKGQGCAAYMLTGDNEKAAQSAADKLGIPHRAGLLPQDKVCFVKELMRDGVTAFAGDGINDTPVLAAADVGFAMGGLGQDAAIEAADVVIMDDDVRKIALAKTISSKTYRIAIENIVFSLLIKIGVLVLGAMGIANMYMAVFADVGVTLLCVINSLRMMKR